MTPYNFFLKHAGYSYNPQTETKEQGRRRCAKALAQAERQAHDEGFSFEWSVDPYINSSEWIDDDEDGGKNCDPWQTWQCLVRDPAGRIVSSLHGIDFGRDGEPWGNPYRRVVEAELALDTLTERTAS